MAKYYTRLKILNVDALGSVFKTRIANNHIVTILTLVSAGQPRTETKVTYFNSDGTVEKQFPAISTATTVYDALNVNSEQRISAHWEIFDLQLSKTGKALYNLTNGMQVYKSQRIWHDYAKKLFTSEALDGWNEAIIKPYLAGATGRVNQGEVKPVVVAITNPQGIIRITAYHKLFKEVNLYNDYDTPTINHPIARQGEKYRSLHPKSIVQTVIGDMIVHVRTGDKVETFVVPYSSGKGTSDQTTPDAGPTPEGVYSVDPKTVQNMSMTDRLKGERQNSDELAFHNLAKLTIADADYGIFRVKLNIDSSNPTTRHSMYIHGGKRMGSIGCLDVGKRQNWFYEQLQKSTHPFPVYVHWKK